MKFLLAGLLLISGVNSFAKQSHRKADVGAPPNAVSRGTAESSGISDSPTGTTKEEAKQMRSRAQSMGGAPNAGAGTGTGSGAGTTIGGDDGDIGKTTAGSTSGEQSEE